MGFERRHAFRVPSVTARYSAVRDALPPQLAFLADRVDRRVLVAAMAIARRERMCPARALIANGLVSARRYYETLAAHLDRPFIADWPEIEALVEPGAAVDSGAVAMVGRAEASWLVAPEGKTLLDLLRSPRQDLADIAITTPAHLAALIHFRAQEAVAYRASASLPDAATHLSARDMLDRRCAIACVAAAAVLGLGAVFAPSVVGTLFGFTFFACMFFRLVVSAYGFARSVDEARPLRDDELPSYTILVPLRREAEVLDELLQALAAIDYPRGKLQVLLLIEPEDRETRAALASARLPPWLQVVFGPRGGTLRTKPRALNIGLDMARGALITVYDAEDRPEKNQLRRAAARFASEPDLACLQARLRIDRTAGSLLAWLFAIEYAALYDIFNEGVTHLGLPMALGGTSNHFRVPALRAAGGWDAWNVTEDADLGLRFYRFGYRVDTLASTTFEAAPRELSVWMKQRRRWMKGWMQTFLVLVRDAPEILRSLGPARGAALALMLASLVIGPSALPVFTVIVVYRLACHGLPSPNGFAQTLEATLAASVLLMGLGSTLWCGFEGIRKTRRWFLLPVLPLLVPYQFLISYATLAGAWDLVRRPHHWHKTPHPATGPELRRGGNLR